MQDTSEDLKALRESFGVSQSVFASHMGVPFRTYQDIEGGQTQLRTVHIRAAEMAALQLACDQLRFDLLPEKLQMIVTTLADEARSIPRINASR